MVIGIPKEIKAQEYRVGMVPGGAHTLVNQGHEVLIQAGAGEGAGYSDEEFARAGARIVPEANGVYANAELICKVK